MSTQKPATENNNSAQTYNTNTDNDPLTNVTAKFRNSTPQLGPVVNPIPTSPPTDNSAKYNTPHLLKALRLMGAPNAITLAPSLRVGSDEGAEKSTVITSSVSGNTNPSGMRMNEECSPSVSLAATVESGYGDSHAAANDDVQKCPTAQKKLRMRRKSTQPNCAAGDIFLSDTESETSPLPVITSAEELEARVVAAAAEDEKNEKARALLPPTVENPRARVTLPVGLPKLAPNVSPAALKIALESQPLPSLLISTAFLHKQCTRRNGSKGATSSSSSNANVKTSEVFCSGTNIGIEKQPEPSPARNKCKNVSVNTAEKQQDQSEEIDLMPDINKTHQHMDEEQLQSSSFEAPSRYTTDVPSSRPLYSVFAPVSALQSEESPHVVHINNNNNPLPHSFLPINFSTPSTSSPTQSFKTKRAYTAHNNNSSTSSSLPAHIQQHASSLFSSRQQLSGEVLTTQEGHSRFGAHNSFIQVGARTSEHSPQLVSQDTSGSHCALGALLHRTPPPQFRNPPSAANHLLLPAPLNNDRQKMLNSGQTYFDPSDDLNRDQQTMASQRHFPASLLTAHHILHGNSPSQLQSYIPVGEQMVSAATLNSNNNDYNNNNNNYSRIGAMSAHAALQQQVSSMSDSSSPSGSGIMGRLSVGHQAYGIGDETANHQQSVNVLRQLQGGVNKNLSHNLGVYMTPTSNSPVVNISATHYSSGQLGTPHPMSEATTASSHGYSEVQLGWGSTTMKPQHPFQQLQQSAQQRFGGGLAHSGSSSAQLTPSGRPPIFASQGKFAAAYLPSPTPQQTHQRLPQGRFGMSPSTPYTMMGANASIASNLALLQPQTQQQQGQLPYSTNNQQQHTVLPSPLLPQFEAYNDIYLQLQNATINTFNNSVSGGSGTVGMLQVSPGHQPNSLSDGGKLFSGQGAGGSASSSHCFQGGQTGTSATFSYSNNTVSQSTIRNPQSPMFATSTTQQTSLLLPTSTPQQQQQQPSQYQMSTNNYSAVHPRPYANESPPAIQNQNRPELTARGNSGWNVPQHEPIPALYSPVPMTSLRNQGRSNNGGDFPHSLINNTHSINNGSAGNNVTMSSPQNCGSQMPTVQDPRLSYNNSDSSQQQTSQQRAFLANQPHFEQQRQHAMPHNHPSIPQQVVYPQPTLQQQTHQFTHQNHRPGQPPNAHHRSDFPSPMAKINAQNVVVGQPALSVSVLPRDVSEVKVTVGSPSGQPSQKRSLMVNNIPSDCEEDEINQLFSAVGPLEGLRIIKDKVSQKSKGYAFVYFRHSQDAELAMLKYGAVHQNTAAGSSTLSVPETPMIRGQKLKLSYSNNVFIKGIA